MTLFFLHGAGLDDPDEILQGTGKTIRGIRLEGGAKDLANPAVRALLLEAIRRTHAPLPTRGRGRTVVKSVSPKKRPRTPAKKKR